MGKGIRSGGSLLNRPRIVEEAVLIADEEGLEALSMRSLATSLGIEAMSLYGHVSSKEDLLGEMVDWVYGSLPPYEGGDWRVALKQRAEQLRKVLLEHRWALLLMRSDVNVGVGLLKYRNDAIHLLMDAGVPLEKIGLCLSLVDGFVYGYVLHESCFSKLDVKDFEEIASEFEETEERGEGSFRSMKKLLDSLDLGSNGGLLVDFHAGLSVALAAVEEMSER